MSFVPGDLVLLRNSVWLNALWEHTWFGEERGKITGYIVPNDPMIVVSVKGHKGKREPIKIYYEVFIMSVKEGVMGWLDTAQIELM